MGRVMQGVLVVVLGAAVATGAAMGYVQQRSELTQVRADLAAESEERASYLHELERARSEADRACPEGPGEEAAVCVAQREGLTERCPETDHYVRSLDECTPEALFGPDWQEYVDQ